MKKGIFILISLLVMISHASSASEADKEITRALIVVRLLNQVEWQDNALNRLSSSDYRLCVYREPSVYSVFKKHFKELTINSRRIKILKLSSKDASQKCHAIFISDPDEDTLTWFVQNKAEQSVIVAEGEGLAKAGAHIGLYLNVKGFYDFEVNPDAFVRSQHSLTIGLLALGNVLINRVAEKAQLMRSLINYTEWPNQKSLSEKFQLCSYPNNAFAVFATHFLAKKSLKGKKIQLKLVDSVESLTGCEAFILGGAAEKRLRKMVSERTVQNILLIGNSPGFGEKGAHYNLAPQEKIQNRRFEINLIAFEMTGHVPNYQLLNSAFLVKNDYPELTHRLVEVLEATHWPDKKSNNKNKLSDVRLCIYRSQKQIDSIIYLLPTYLAEQFNSETANPLKVKLIDLMPESQKTQCDALLMQDLTQNELYQLINKQQQPQALLITNQTSSNQKNAESLPIHFNLFSKPKAIALEVYLKNIQQSGFTTTRQLLKNSIVIGGQAND